MHVAGSRSGRSREVAGDRDAGETGMENNFSFFVKVSPPVSFFCLHSIRILRIAFPLTKGHCQKLMLIFHISDTPKIYSWF